MTYAQTLPEVFPFWARVTKWEALDIVEMLVRDEQMAQDGSTAPEGSSFAVVSGLYPLGKPDADTRLIWLSWVSYKRVTARWPDSTVQWNKAYRDSNHNRLY